MDRSCPSIIVTDGFANQILAIFLLFLLQTQYWWGIYTHRESLEELSFFGYFIYIVPVILFAILVETAFPESLLKDDNEQANLEDFYWQMCRELYIFANLVLVFEIVEDYLILSTGFRSSTLSWLPMVIRSLGIVLVSILAWKNQAKYKRLHFYILVCLTVFLLLYISTQSLYL